MKKLASVALSLSLLFGVTASHAHMSYIDHDIYAIFDKVVEPYKHLNITFEVVPDKIPQAYIKIFQDHIVITTGMLDKLKSEGEVAAVIGHEIGHALLMYMLDPSYGAENEAKADIIGVHLSTLAGYKGCEVSNYWRREFHRIGDVPSESHPVASSRAEATSCKHVWGILR